MERRTHVKPMKREFMKETFWDSKCYLLKQVPERWSGVSLYECFCAATAHTSPTEEVWRLHTRIHVYASSRERLGQRRWGKARQTTTPGLTNENLNTALFIYYLSPSTSSRVRRISIPRRWCWRRIPVLGAKTRMQGRTRA